MIEEQAIQIELQQLEQLIGQHPVIQAFKEVEMRARTNRHLQELEEQIKAAQKEAVQFAHYGKPEAEKQAILRIEELTAVYNQQPLVVRYREMLFEANDLLQFVTNTVQKKVNQALEEELGNASKN